MQRHGYREITYGLALMSAYWLHFSNITTIYLALVVFYLLQLYKTFHNVLVLSTFPLLSPQILHILIEILAYCTELQLGYESL